MTDVDEGQPENEAGCGTRTVGLFGAPISPYSIRGFLRVCEYPTWPTLRYEVLELSRYWIDWFMSLQRHVGILLQTLDTVAMGVSYVAA